MMRNLLIGGGDESSGGTDYISFRASKLAEIGRLEENGILLCALHHPA